MNILFGGKTITSDELRTKSFALLSLATAVDRYKLQLAQSKAKPGDAKERKQANNAASAVFRAHRKVKALFADGAG